MQTVEHVDYITVEEYLAAEAHSDVRHEYLGGVVYAMAGGTQQHNTICLNFAVALRQHLKGRSCKVFMSDMRVNFDLQHDEYFYYPDLVVTCDTRDTNPRFVRHPKLLIEVLSPGTERVDRREKLFAYRTIEALEEYVLVGQEQKEVVVFRRANGWQAEKILGADASVSLTSLELNIPLAAIYEGV